MTWRVRPSSPAAPSSSTRRLWIGYLALGQAYASAGEPDLALEAIADGERVANGNSKVASLRGYVLARMGRTAAAREVVASLAQSSPARYVPLYAAALVYAGLGERQAMFDALERAYAARDVHLMYLPVDMKWDPVPHRPALRRPARPMPVRYTSLKEVR